MAEVESDRVKRLVEKDIISPIRLEQAMAETDVARLRVQQAKSRLQRAETNYSYTTITSPFEGYVDRIPFKVGSLVTPTSLLTSLTDVSEMFAYYKINEKEYLEYKRTQLSGADQPEYKNLELELSDQTIYPYKGTVETVEGDFERGTGSIAFRARFVNPEGLLRHGVSGKIRMLTKMDNVILVPQRSTFEIQDFTYVYTVNEEGKVSARSFEPLSRHGAYYVTKDLPDGALIVYEGVQQVSDGMVITPEMIDTETVRKQLEVADNVENK
jgi:membrane fusion protein (multidrug efflux system)